VHLVHLVHLTILQLQMVSWRLSTNLMYEKNEEVSHSLEGTYGEIDFDGVKNLIKSKHSGKLLECHG
jgi:hypothetical protein